MSPMRVLHVSRPIQGGVPHVARALVADQVRRGWDVAVACPQESDLHGYAVEAGARYIPWAATRSPGPTTPDETRRLARILKQERPQLAHLHSSKAGLAGRLALRGNLPTIFQPHGWSFDMASGPMARAAAGWERLSARWTHALVCVSDGERARGEREGIKAPWAVIPNGVDLSRFARSGPAERAAARAQLDIDATAPMAVLVGRFCREKAQDTMLEAWDRVLARVPEAQLAFIGDGEPDERAALQARAPRGVHFPGWLTDPSPWLVASNVVAVPSRSEAGLSLVAMEGMALGRSVVATDVPGMRAGLEGGAGAVVPIDAVEDIADALVERLSDLPRADSEGQIGRQTVEARFSLEGSCEQMAELSMELVANQ